MGMYRRAASKYLIMASLVLTPSQVGGEEKVKPSTSPSRPFPLYEEREAIDPEVGIVSRSYCEGDGPMNRTCTFHNLCYDGKYAATEQRAVQRSCASMQMRVVGSSAVGDEM